MDDIKITVNTSKGPINLTLFPDDAPVTCANFLNLAGRGYYDGLKFHRVIPDFMAQGGDPNGPEPAQQGGDSVTSSEAGSPEGSEGPDREETPTAEGGS